jgi:hypothetical protein
VHDELGERGVELICTKGQLLRRGLPGHRLESGRLAGARGDV